jgi:hypothetical protein
MRRIQLLVSGYQGWKNKKREENHDDHSQNKQVRFFHKTVYPLNPVRLLIEGAKVGNLLVNG